VPPAKRVARKSPAKTLAQHRIIIKETKMVPINSVKLFHKNPRVGNVDLIAKSLHLNSQYKPIVVNIGTHTGRANEILAGNHTWLGARRDVTWEENIGGEVIEYHKEPWTEIYATFVDVDEAQAAKIVLVDNKSADEGTYDDLIIADLFKNLPDVSGTGFSSLEVDEILAGVRKDIEESGGMDQRSLDDIMKDMPTTTEETDTRSAGREPVHRGKRMGHPRTGPGDDPRQVP
jgi:hypothetical protein